MNFNYIIIIIIVAYLLSGLYIAATQNSGDNAFNRVVYAWMFTFFWPITIIAKYLHILK